MNKKQIIVILAMIASMAFLYGLHEVSVMYKQPNGLMYDRWEIILYELGPFDNLLLDLLCWFKVTVAIVVLFVSGFLVFALRNKVTSGNNKAI